ncbi:hypothetical protein Ctob_015493, partial [Chrysochromulina tobinii]
MILVTVLVELRVFIVCAGEGEIQTFFLNLLVVLDHATDVLAMLSMTARGCGEFAFYSLIIIAISAAMGVLVTAGELLDDELEAKLAEIIISFFKFECCQTDFWKRVMEQLVENTEMVAMPFVSLSGLIPMLSTAASWVEHDAAASADDSETAATHLGRAQQKKLLAAQVRMTRGLVGSAPQCILTFAYLLTQNNWNDFIAVLSVTASMLVAVYAVAAEAERPELGNFVLGGNFVKGEEAKVKAKVAPATPLPRGKGIQHRPTFAHPSPERMSAWIKEREIEIHADWRDQQKGRILMGYYFLDLVLRALAAAACIASWSQYGMLPFDSLTTVLLALSYLIGSVMLFPAKKDSVGYNALSTNPFCGALLLLYATIATPASALILCFPAYFVCECMASTALSVGITLIHLPGLLNLFRPPDLPWQEDTYGFGDAAGDVISIMAIIAGCALGKLAIAYFFIWPPFAAGKHTNYLESVGPLEWSAYVGGAPPSPPLPSRIR